VIALNWLIVERYENWQVDCKNKFQFFGISNRKTRLASTMSEGDLLFTYVSGVKAFSDIRVVRSNELIKFKVQYEYDEPFLKAIKTKPVITLPEDNWLSVYDVLDRLSFTKGKKRWSNFFYHQFKQLSEENAGILKSEIEKLSLHNK